MRWSKRACCPACRSQRIDPADQGDHADDHDRRTGQRTNADTGMMMRVAIGSSAPKPA